MQFARLSKSALLITIATIQVAVADVKFTTVALSGQQAPGMPTGVLFNGFEAPSINPSGQVSFRAFAFGGSPPVDEAGLWSGHTGSLSLVARDSQQAVGTPAGVTYGEVGGPAIANSGGVFFASTLEGPGVVANQNDKGFFSSATGPLSLVARSGSQAAGFGAGVTYRNLSGALQTPGGQLAMSGRVQGPGVTIGVNENVIWQGAPGGLSVLARTGTQAPGTSPGTNYQFFNPAFVMNHNGTVAFQAALTGGGVGQLDAQGIWAGQPGQVQLQVRSGSQAPGAPVGSNLFNINIPSINNSGRISFTSGLTGAGFNNSMDGIWSKPAGGPAELVVHRNMTAPLPAPGVAFGAFSDPFLMGNDQVAFRATLMGSGVNSGNDGSVWRGMPGMLQVILREGEHAPGTPDGVNFATFLQSDIAGNAAGQVIVRSTLSGAGVGSNNNLGLWMSDPAQGLVMLARKGTPFEVAPGIMKTPNDFFIYTQTGGQDGRPSGLMNADQFAIRAHFDDGTSGVFIVTIPEPASGLLAMGGLLLTVAHRRREQAR